jgi:hypothetical protein
MISTGAISCGDAAAERGDVLGDARGELGSAFPAVQFGKLLVGDELRSAVLLRAAHLFDQQGYCSVQILVVYQRKESPCYRSTSAFCLDNLS